MSATATPSKRCSFPRTIAEPLHFHARPGCARLRLLFDRQAGFNRNLTVAEIIGQLWQANNALGAVHGDERVISNVVMMGMGEPLANFENTVAALRFDARRQRLRPVAPPRHGKPLPVWCRSMDRLRDECPVALAVSLHAPNDKLRDELVPINQKYPLKDLMAACQRYLEKAPRDFITFEYTMIDGINDSEGHARELLALVRNVPCKFNLIPFNPSRVAVQAVAGGSGAPLCRYPDAGRYRHHDAQDAGDDIDAACGQLAGQVKDKTKRTAGRVIPLMEARS